MAELEMVDVWVKGRSNMQLMEGRIFVGFEVIDSEGHRWDRTNPIPRSAVVRADRLTPTPRPTGADLVGLRVKLLHSGIWWTVLAHHGEKLWLLHSNDSDTTTRCEFEVVVVEGWD